MRARTGEPEPSGDSTRVVRAARRGLVTVGAWPAVGWIVAFMVAPLAIMVVYSFWRYAQYTLRPDFTLDNYRAFFANPVYLRTLARTVGIGLLVTVIAVGLAYPLALFLYRQGRRLAAVVIALVTVPFWVNSLVRNFAFYGLLGENGLINASLAALGAGPVRLMFTVEAVVIVGVYIFLPYAVVMLYASMERISPALLEAAQDLGASGWQTFARVIFPLSLSGLQSAVLFVLIPALGMFLTPAIVGGGRTPMMANLIVPMISETLNFARGAAFSIILFAMVLVMVIALGRSLDLENLYRSGTGRSVARQSGERPSMWVTATVGVTLGFLYAPILLVVLFSFDRNVTAGFPLQGPTLEWYRAFFADSIMLRALRNSLAVAAATAVITTLVAVPAAYTVVRRSFVWRRALQLSMLIPIIVPEVLLAVGLLLLMVQVGVPLSLGTVVLGHVTYALPFVFFVALTQQYGFDRSIEQAAEDLGATAWQRFRLVVLPMMLPAMFSGAILAFTLSLNDFVLAFMLAGRSATLPVFMWSLLQTSITPEINAVATLLVGGTVGIVCGWVWAERLWQWRRGDGGRGARAG